MVQKIEQGKQDSYLEIGNFSMSEFHYQSEDLTVSLFGAQRWAFESVGLQEFLKENAFESAVAHHTGAEDVGTERFKSVNGKVVSTGKWYDGSAKEKFYEFVKQEVGTELEEHDNDVEDYLQTEGDRGELGTAFAAKFGKEYEPFIGML